MGAEDNKRLPRRALDETVRDLRGMFGGLRFEIEDEIAVAVRHIYIWRTADDKIVEHWGSRDDLGLLGQLGLLPSGE